MAFMLHHLLSESASRTPESVAIRLLEQSLTYAELEDKSTKFACALLSTGVAPGDCVGLYLGKSLDAIIAIFGILKSGACYVPVDHTAPGYRLADIVSQCKIRVLISSATLYEKSEENFDENSPLEWVFLTDNLTDRSHKSSVQFLDFSQTLVSQTCEFLPNQGTDRDIAYILFTSGSTGKPKGVMLSHLNALTFVNWGYETFSVKPTDCLSNHAPLNFDLSIFDIFVALKAGASVSLIPDGLSSFPIRLSELIEQHKITIWYSVPSVLIMLLNRGKLEKRDLSKLRLILFAGEVFPVKHLRQLMQVLQHPKYFNLYGPTETNVCTYYEVSPIPENQLSPIPLGKACSNMDVFLVDEDNKKITAPRQEGLLCVRGSTVMQGYYARHDETNKVLINNYHLASGQCEKFYITGDLVTIDELGNYHFIGRKDHLIKIRGYRVELGEIESVLYSHPAILEAVAIDIIDELMVTQIKAFIVSRESYLLTESEVKHYCSKLLPRYMIPEQIELQSSLPRTATNKVDRQLLKVESLNLAKQVRDKY
jgi:amino acid adenylation domain-containing protein